MTDLPMASQESEASSAVSRPRHSLNARGPFYTENICLTCWLPVEEAPNLVGFNEDASSAAVGCFFKKQPETPDELDFAFSAMLVNCIDTLRYGGTDIAILQRLREMGLEDQCDYPLPK